MFKCEECGRLTQPRERQAVVPVALRPVSYLIRSDRECIGTETVKELKVCPNCAEKLEDRDPAFTQPTKYIEFPRKLEDLKKVMPSNTIMSAWPRNYEREKRKQARKQARARQQA